MTPTPRSPRAMSDSNPPAGASPASASVSGGGVPGPAPGSYST